MSARRYLHIMVTALGSAKQDVVAFQATVHRQLRERSIAPREPLNFDHGIPQATISVIGAEHFGINIYKLKSKSTSC